jgi:hypothetical protein
MMLGFGRRVTWSSGLDIPPGHQMTFKDALYALSTNISLMMVIPEWAKNLTKRTARVHLAFRELEVCHSDLAFVPDVP